MITPDAVLADRPTVDWENEGGALASLPEREAAAVPPESWRALMTLGAVVAVWQDLSASVRHQIARDAVVATNWVEPPGHPRLRAPPSPRGAPRATS